VARRRRPGRGLREPVGKGCAVRRILAGRLVLRYWRIGIAIATYPVSVRGFEEVGIGMCHSLADLAQWNDVIEDPEGPPVRAHDQVVVVYPEIAHRGVR